MYLSHITIENFRCFGEGGERFTLALRPGLTALVGENDAGKTAVIDALRFVLGTTDPEWCRLEDTDFYREETSRQIRIVCKFEKLTARDKMAFVEYLTYAQEPPHDPVLYVNWTAKDTSDTHRGRGYRRPEVCSGQNGDGPALAPEVRDLLRTTYLRPLRDAEQALSAGRASRLAQVLQQTGRVTKGGHPYDPAVPVDPMQPTLSVLGIGDLANALLETHVGVQETRGTIDANLQELSLLGEARETSIEVGSGRASEDVRVRRLLEKLDLALRDTGKPGLGSSNRLFIACELVLLAQEEDGNRMILIEEPEAHLHPQRQLRVMRYLQDQARDKQIQVIVTTHSPNLASAIELDNVVMVQRGRAFPLAKGQTALDESDYGFLQRFLDVTKANLFFARGVVIVEGDAENILLPTLASLLGRDFTKNGVSIVNVGGLGLSRYARIFLRKDPDKDGQLNIPVACVTDMDVMPDCAPEIIGRVRKDEEWPKPSKRRWRAKRDVGGEDALADLRIAKEGNASGQRVKTFVSDEWTLEYDLALGTKGVDGEFAGGLSEDVFVAACLAAQENAIGEGKWSVEDVTNEALSESADWAESLAATDDCTWHEVRASTVYAKFVSARASKATAAQYLAQRLQDKVEKGELTPDELRRRLPKYLTEAIDYVTSAGSETSEHEREEDDQ